MHFMYLIWLDDSVAGISIGDWEYIPGIGETIERHGEYFKVFDVTWRVPYGTVTVKAKEIEK